MTKKKRELIEILLDNVKPEDWPENLPYAAQDKCSFAVYAYPESPTRQYSGLWSSNCTICANLIINTINELCKHWNKTIVHRDEFMKRWNERIRSDEKESQISEKEKTQEWLSKPMTPCSEEIPCHFVDIKSPLQTQISGDHYTKLSIQPMQCSMKNGLDPLQHTIIKYVTRFRDKAGIEDLEKAKHCIDMLIEFEKESK